MLLLAWELSHNQTTLMKHRLLLSAQISNIDGKTQILTTSRPANASTTAIMSISQCAVRLALSMKQLQIIEHPKFRSKKKKSSRLVPTTTCFLETLRAATYGHRILYFTNGTCLRAQNAAGRRNI